MSAPCIKRFLEKRVDIKHYRILENQNLHIWLSDKGQAEYVVNVLLENSTIIDEIKALPTNISDVRVMASNFIPKSRGEKRRWPKQLVESNKSNF